MVSLMIFAQIEVGMEWINNLLNTYGIAPVIFLLLVIIVLLVALGYLYGERGARDIDAAIANQMEAYTKQVNENASRNNDRLDRMEEKLEAARELRETEKEIHEERINQLKSEREKLKLDLERSLTNEAETNRKLKLVDAELVTLRKRIADLEAEHKRDKIEKEQMVREQKLTQKQLDVETQKRKEVERERSILEKMLADYSKRIENLESDMRRLNDKLDSRDMELRQAYGTIATLTSKLSKLTDDTSEIPNVEVTTDSEGDEILTPVLKQDAANENDNDNDNGNDETKDKAA